MNKKVLIIDGDKQLIPILKEAFHKIGFEVFVETAREQALDFARENQPGLVIACVELPAGPAEGYLVCKDFKSSAELKDTPFLLTSRNAKEEDFNKHRKLKTRADDYLKKPFTDEELFQRVENLLGFEISKQDYNQLEEKMHTYLEQQTKLEDELRERDEEIRKLKQQLAEAGTAKNAKKSGANDEEVAAFKRDLALKDGEIASLQKKAEAAKAKAEKTTQDLEQKLGALEQALAEKTKALDQAEVESSGYEERLRDSDALLDGYKSKNKELQAKLTQLEKKSNELAASLAEQSSERDDLDEKIAKLSSEQEKFEQEKAAWSEREDEHKDELKRLQNELDAAMYEIKELEKDLKAQRKQQEKFRAAAEKLVAALADGESDSESADDDD